MPPPNKPNKPKTKVQPPKKTPKKEYSEQERVKRLFSLLCSQIDGGHFVNATKTCDKILRILPGDVDALTTKLFLLLQTDQYELALALIDGDKTNFVFERAYALYRSHDDSQAQKLIQSLKQQDADDRGLAHLEAQLFYRQGLYEQSLVLYNELLDSTEPNTEEHSDILTNLQASQKHLDFINQDYLRAMDALPASITNVIENAPPPAPGPSIPAAILAASARSAVPVDKPKKVRMSRVPAGVTPGVTPPPDPERWLKKSERTTYNQGRRRRGGGGGGGATQGSAATEAPTSGGGASTGRSGGGKGKRKK